MTRIAIIGLGYVGLPLGVALARHGADHRLRPRPARASASSRAGRDRTGEVAPEALAASSARADRRSGRARRPRDLHHHRADPGRCSGTCPTSRPCAPPAGRSARRSRKGAIVVLESTVYPGATEEVVGPTLAESSGLEAGADFFLGYSPERINPGRPRAHARADHQGGRRPDARGRGPPRRDLRPGDRRPGLSRAATSAPPRRPRRSRTPSATSTSPSSTRSR